jgi:type I restriction enzyme S subunit
MAVKAGYKLTEAGLIPESWIVYSIGELINFEGGSQPDKNYFRPSNQHGYIRLIQIRDYKTDRFETYVPRHLARRFCSEDDIMIGRYGPPIFQILKGLAGAYNVALIKAKPTQDINKTYAYYFLKQEKLLNFIEKLSQRSSGQTGIDLRELRSYPIPLPPTLTEQTAIATALRDADALIESLEQLIHKNRNIKQAAMQELLTGKKRLPGFSGEWVEKLLPDICLFRGGKAHEQYISDAGPYICVNSKFISTDGYVRKYSTANFCCAKKNDILMVMSDLPNGKALAKVYLADKDDLYAVNQRVCALTAYRDDPVFLSFVLNRNPYFLKFDDGVSQTHLLNGVFNKCPVYLPLDVKEQTAIATILSDMDAGIAALEEKLNKAKAVKQGMMQELLTGRVRLV